MRLHSLRTIRNFHSFSQLRQIEISKLINPCSHQWGCIFLNLLAHLYSVASPWHFTEQALHVDILSLVGCYPPLHPFYYLQWNIWIYLLLSFLPCSHTLCPALLFSCMVLLHASASACSSHLAAAQRRCLVSAMLHLPFTSFLSSMDLRSCAKMSHMETCYAYVMKGLFLC